MSAIAAVTLGSVPAAFMLICTFAGLKTRVSPSVAGALQHFAAGVLLCTIGTELLPAMVEAVGWEQNLAAAIGFFSGVSLLIVLGVVLPEAENGGDDHDDDDSAKQTAKIPTAASPSSPPSTSKRDSLLGRRCSIKAAAFHAQDVSSSLTKSAATVSEISGLLSLSETLSQHQSPIKKPFPTALILAVAIDSLIDGLLIGIAVAAGPSAGPMMSASLSVEMSFLGLTLAAALNGHPSLQSILAAFLGPLSILAGAAIGGLMAYQLGHNPVLLVGMLSFGTSALLFMVAEELLLEAHEGEAEHVWWVDLQLYTGFFASVVAGKFVPS